MKIAVSPRVHYIIVIYYLAVSLSVLTVPDWLQLAEVDRHGPVPSEVETVEGIVLLRLVHNSEDDVVIVPSELIVIKLGIEHPYSALRGSKTETSSQSVTMFYVST